MALLKTEIAELFDCRLGKFGDGFAALGGELLAKALNFLEQLLTFGVDAGQFSVALFEVLEFFSRFGPKGKDFLHRAAIFSFKRVDEIQTLFELLKAGRVSSTESK